MRTLIFSLLMALSSIVLGQSFNAPESVVFDENNHRYLVSNAGNGMTGGSIIAVDRNTLTNSAFISTGIGSPKGMLILGNYLYFTDVTYVRKADLNTGALISSYSITGASFLNDIVHLNGYFYISDNQASKIFKFNLGNETIASIIDPPTIINPNGLAYDTLNNRIVCVSFRVNSPIQGIHLTNDSVFLIAPTNLNNLDGVVFDKDGNIYVSSWGTGAIYRNDGSCCDPFHEFANGFSGPADICIASNDTMIVPNFNTNSLSFLGIHTGINRTDNPDLFIISPNPATTHITITNQGNPQMVNIAIFNRWGSEVRSLKPHFSSKGDTLNISLDGLAAGVYFYTIKGKEKVLLSGSFVKQ